MHQIVGFFLMEDKYPFVMADNDLSTQGAKASVTMVLTKIPLHIIFRGNCEEPT